MLDVRQTETFTRWLTRLRDERARVLIAARIERLAFGHLGDSKPIGEGLSELRIHYGPGYRLYFQRRGKELIILLCGGDKRTQTRDIAAAKIIASTWNE